MTNYIQILGLLLFGLTRTNPQPPINTVEDLPRYLERIVLTEGQSSIRLSWLPPGFGPAAIQYLAVRVNDPEPRIQLLAKTALVGLGHQQTIENVLAEYEREDETASEILRTTTGSVELSKLLIPIFNSSSINSRKNHDDQYRASVKYKLAYCIIRYINASDVFPKKTLNWAGLLACAMELDEENPNFHPVWLLQQFLENNKDSITSGDYSKAAWLPMFEGEVDKFSCEWQSLPKYSSHIKVTHEIVKNQVTTAIFSSDSITRPTRRPQASVLPQVLSGDIQGSSNDSIAKPAIRSLSAKAGWVSCIAVSIAAIIWHWKAKRNKAKE